MFVILNFALNTNTKQDTKDESLFAVRNIECN